MTLPFRSVLFGLKNHLGSLLDMQLIWPHPKQLRLCRSRLQRSSFVTVPQGIFGLLWKMLILGLQLWGPNDPHIHGLEQNRNFLTENLCPAWWRGGVAGSPGALIILNFQRQVPILSCAGLNRGNCSQWAPECIPRHFQRGRPVCSPYHPSLPGNSLGGNRRLSKTYIVFPFLFSLSLIEVELAYNTV